MRHKYQKLSEILLAALENVPLEESVSVSYLISISFDDFKWVKASYSEELKEHQNPYYFFGGEKWSHGELIHFTIKFYQVAKNHGFYLDNTRFRGGCYGTPDNIPFFVRRKPISKRILFQVKEYSANSKTEDSDTKQVKVYYDGAVKSEIIRNIGRMTNIEKPLEKTCGGTYLANRQIVEKIKNIYKENADKIKALPQKIDNESCNGYFQEFSFGAKKIICQNIHGRSEDEKTILQILADIKNIIDSSTPENEWSIRWHDFNFLR